jgi:REP element-mobilizing transposase RayT
MPYAPRIEEAGAYYHVNGKAVDGVQYFRREEDRLAFLRLLEREVCRSDWQCLIYCLMGTHFHMLIRLRECSLSSGMQHLGSMYSRGFNREYGRRGALVQRRFFGRPIETDGHLRETVRYIARNPTRANLCERPEDYEWCSYSSSVSGTYPDPVIDESELLGLFGTRPDVARRRLRAFVDEPDPRKRRSQRPL